MKIFYDNLIDYAGVVVTASSANSLLPAKNVLNEQRKKVWRTGTTLTTEFITFDLLTAKSASALVVCDFAYNQAAVSVNFLLYGSTDNFVASDVLIGATAYDGTQTSLFTFSPVSYRYWRVRVVKDNAADTVDIGRLFIGPTYTTEEPPDFDGYSSELVDPSPIQKSLGGQGYSDIREKFRMVKTEFTRVANAMAENLRTFAERVGNATPFFIQVDTVTPLDKVLYVKLKKGLKRQVAGFDASLYWNVDLEFEEQL